MPDTTIRDKSTAALAEALHTANGSGCLHEDGYGGTGWVQCDKDASWVMECSPTLARRIDFGTAWDEAVAAAEAAITEDTRIEGEAVGIVGVVPYSFGDHAYVAQTYPPVPFASAYSESPTDALVALTEALRERAR